MPPKESTIHADVGGDRPEAAESQTGRRVGDARTVHVQQQAVAVSDIGQRPNSSGRYTVPSSVACAIETTRGWTRCSSPRGCSAAGDHQAAACRRAWGPAISLQPVNRSGAPHSSTSMWAPCRADHGVIRSGHRLQAEHVRRGPVADQEGRGRFAEVRSKSAFGRGGVRMPGRSSRHDRVGVGDGPEHFAGWTPALLSLAKWRTRLIASPSPAGAGLDANFHASGLSHLAVELGDERAVDGRGPSWP